MSGHNVKKLKINRHEQENKRKETRMKPLFQVFFYVFVVYIKLLVLIANTLAHITDSTLKVNTSNVCRCIGVYWFDNFIVAKPN